MYDIIITASIIPSHPKIDCIKQTIESLGHLNNKNTNFILAHDFSEEYRYKEYIENLNNFISENQNFKIVINNKKGHLTGNLRNAFNYVSSDFVLIVQHDLPFIKRIDPLKIIEDMELNNELKHIRFNTRRNVRAGFDAINNLFGKQLKSKNYTYTRTPGWSDQNHICRKSYYKDFVLNICKDGNFMERYLHGKSKDEKTHSIFGTYLFGPINDSASIKNLDGRKLIVRD